MNIDTQSAEQNNDGHLDRLTKLLGAADETYAALPPKVLLEIEEVAKSMPEYGPRRLFRTGPGTEVYDTRAFREGDDRRTINARLSARRGYEIVTERQAENRQPVFLWRKGTGSTTVKYEPSNPERLTKKEYLDVVMLASAMSVTSAEDRVGVLDHGGLYTGPAGVLNVTNQFFDVNIVTGNLPVIGRQLPVGSTVILGSDFFDAPDNQARLADALQAIKSLGVNGVICMVIDPEEADFTFQGHTRFKGLQGELDYQAGKSEALQESFKREMHRHIKWVENVANTLGYKFILQRTDTKPADLALKIFGMAPDSHGFTPQLGRTHG